MTSVAGAKSLDQELGERLETLRQQGLRRELRCVASPQGSRIRIQGKSLLNFSSNDYLGLANDPALKTAAIRCIEQYGAGAGASRLICGSLRPYQDLDNAIASFKGTEAALSFSTGYAAAVGTITALVGPDDCLLLDKLVHACMVDGARLSGAKLRVFPHNDLDRLEELLKWADGRARQSTAGRPRPRTLILTESLFSMDGDQAPLRELVNLKSRYGAWLMVDEAHATGLYGAHRRGLAEAEGVSGQIDVQMGTLGKALGASGGYICGSRVLIDYLVNRARSFIFSTAPVPAAAAAATAGIRLVQSTAGAERRDLLWQRVDQVGHGLGASLGSHRSAILPLPIGDETEAVRIAEALREQEIFIPAIRYPTVARGKARLRLTVTAAHSREEIEQLLSTWRAVQPPTHHASAG